MKLVKTVSLVFFEDNSLENYGVSHKETYNAARYNGSTDDFNAFWDGAGIFHDVFEHWHEYQHKYFRGDFAMNVAGEMAAMGAMWYYYEELGVYNRLTNSSIYSPSQNMRLTTEGIIRNSVEYGKCDFGYTLECNIPKQRPTDNGELEWQINELIQNCHVMHTDKENISEYEYTDEERISIDYKASIKNWKIRNSHRWGFHTAKKLVPVNNDNRQTLSEFIDLWDNFCKRMDAEEMARAFKGITFRIYKDHGRIHWTATLETADYYEINSYKLTPKNIKYFSMEDAWKLEEQY